MSGRLAPSATTRWLSSLTGMGLPGRVLGQRLDRFRAASWRHGRLAWQLSGRGEQDTLYRRQAALYRRIWGEAAAAAGAETEHLGNEFLAIRRDGAETVVRFHLVMMDHPSTIALALDKAVVHDLLARGGVPVPEQRHMGEVSTVDALAFIADSERGGVVKPANGTGGGAGVTCGVHSADDLTRARLAAQVFDSDVLVERAVDGDEYRLLFIEGELLDVVRRERPRVVGDGHSTVTELMAEENRRRLDAGESEVARLLRFDLDCALALGQDGLTARSVPPEGQPVVVKGTVGENARSENATVKGRLADSVVKVAAQAAAISRIRLAGVDLVTPDPTQPLEQAGGAILEVNGTPGLHYHYEVADPEHATAVALPLLERLLARGSAP
jgi:cyanophycin synthetase